MKKESMNFIKAAYPLKQYDRDSWLRSWRWIYKDNPAGTGQIWIADHSGRIVGDCLVSKAIKHGQQNNIDLILYYLLANKTYHRVLKRNGFISLLFIKGGPFCAYSSSPVIPKEFIKNPENWFVQDSDKF